MDSIQSNVGTSPNVSAEEAVSRAVQRPSRPRLAKRSEGLQGEQSQQQQERLEARRARQQARQEQAATSRAADIAPPTRRAVRFRLNRETERFYIQVVDQDTGEVVKEIPPERLLTLGQTLRQATGNLLDRSA
ncbi:MAG TPA: flagellar protein FlaG [Acidobacteriota bacterium]|nr:flagellar protein FlaG [Acidobacteriota bacterium]